MSWRHLSILVISQLLLARFWPNFKGRFLGPSLTDVNCHGDICPGNICQGDICPYQKYLICYCQILTNISAVINPISTKLKVLTILNRFWPKKNFAKKKICLKKIFCKKKLGHKKILPKKTFAQKKFRQKKISTKKISL